MRGENISDIRRSQLSQMNQTRRNFCRIGGAAVLTAAVLGCSSSESTQGAQNAEPDASEAILLPDQPIIDPHHHLWKHSSRSGPYLTPDLLVDLDSGHNILATVFVECGSEYRTTGPDEMKTLGEVEFVIEASQNTPRIAQAIVARADLRLGDDVIPVLEGLIETGQGRVRGLRQSTAYDPAPIFYGKTLPKDFKDLALNPDFRRGFAHLSRLGLSFDAWCLHPNIPDITDLASAFGDTPIVLDHIGSPLGVGPYAGRQQEVFDHWRTSMTALAERPNVSLKFGGLGMPFLGAPLFQENSELRSSETLAALWKPWFDVCIDLFGADRIMFESNFPVDMVNCSYATLWNAMKRLAMPASEDERNALFKDVAARFYHIEIA